MHKPNTLRWKTLGLTTYSRVWSTASIHDNNAKSIHKSQLTISGQSGISQQHRFNMRSNYSRNFAAIKKFIFFLLFLICVCIFFTFVQQAYAIVLHNLSLCQLSNVYTTLMFLGVIFLVLWLRFLISTTIQADLFGLLFCISISSAWKLYRVDGLSPRKYIENPRPIINKFKTRKITRSTQADKFIIQQVYKIFAKLGKLENKLHASTPDSVGFNNNRRQVPLNLKTNLRLFKMYVRLPATQLLPTIEHKLHQNNSATALALFNWYNTHTTTPIRMQNSKSLWNSHRLVSARTHISGIAFSALTINQETNHQTPHQNDACWLVQLQPITTSLIENHKYPIRYDMLQNNKIAQNALWSKRRSFVKIKIK